MVNVSFSVVRLKGSLGFVRLTLRAKAETKVRPAGVFVDVLAVIGACMFQRGSALCVVLLVMPSGEVTVVMPFAPSTIIVCNPAESVLIRFVSPFERSWVR